MQIWHLLWSVTNVERVLYLQTNLSAPKYKIVTVDLDTLTFQDLIPMTDANLSSAIRVAQDKLVVVYKRNVRPYIFFIVLKAWYPVGNWRDLHLFPQRRKDHPSCRRLGRVSPCDWSRRISLVIRLYEWVHIPRDRWPVWLLSAWSQAVVYLPYYSAEWPQSRWVWGQASKLFQFVIPRCNPWPCWTGLV